VPGGKAAEAAPVIPQNFVVAVVVIAVVLDQVVLTKLEKQER
jgi:hypothetical protein